MVYPFNGVGTHQKEWASFPWSDIEWFPYICKMWSFLLKMWIGKYIWFMERISRKYQPETNEIGLFSENGWLRGSKNRNPMGRGTCWATWGHTESDTTELSRIEGWNRNGVVRWRKSDISLSIPFWKALTLTTKKCFTYSKNNHILKLTKMLTKWKC